MGLLNTYYVEVRGYVRVEASSGGDAFKRAEYEIARIASYGENPIDLTPIQAIKKTDYR